MAFLYFSFLRKPFFVAYAVLYTALTGFSLSANPWAPAHGLVSRKEVTWVSKPRFLPC
jgi:hypothetical protein